MREVMVATSLTREVRLECIPIVPLFVSAKN